MKKVLVILVVLCILFTAFIIGVATAFAYPQECYDLFIDKSYPCKIIKLQKGKEVWQKHYMKLWNTGLR